MNSLKKSSRSQLVVCLFAVSLLLNSCKTEKYNFFTPEDLTWMVYSMNDTLVFKNNAGQLRTYKVVDVRRGYLEDGTHDEHVQAKIDMMNDTNDIVSEGYLYLVRKESGLDVTAGWPYFNKVVNPQENPVGIDTINGKPYNDLVILSDTVTTGNIKQVSYSKSKGFVKFIQRNGVIWSINH